MTVVTAAETVVTVEIPMPAKTVMMIVTVETVMTGVTVVTLLRQS